MTNSITAPYEALATEYYDVDRHPTCANFRYLSHQYLSLQLRASDLGSHIVEVGAGRSIAAEILENSEWLKNLTITDQSEGMLTHSDKWKTAGVTVVAADARNLPSHLHGATTIVASLADPYNDAQFWNSAGKALLASGLIFLTIPAFEWASIFRGTTDSLVEKAEFVTDKGEKYEVPSLIPMLHQQVKMMELAGFTLLHYRALTRIDLQSGNISKKLCTGIDAKTPLVWGFTALRQ